MPREIKIFEKPGNVRRARWALFAICVLLLVVDLFVPVHGEFYWERYTGFFAAFGFVACVAMVMASKHLLRFFVRRDEDYYD